VDDGIPPPIAPLIDTIGPFIARDELGLALGGIRIADLEVPTALNTGSNASTSSIPTTGATWIRRSGSWEDNLADGYLTQRDAQTTITGAAQSEIGK
jgi:hypothetical protein